MASLCTVAAVSLNQHVDDFEARLRTHEGLLFEDDVTRLCQLMVTSSFGHGSQPAHRAVDLGMLKLGVTPRRCRIVRQVDNGWGTTRVLVGVDWVAVVRQRTTGETSVSVSALEPSIAEGIVEELKAKAIKPKRKPGTVDITFTHDGRAGTTRQTRAVPAPTWESIRRNYSAGAQTTLDALMALSGDTLPSGRLILIHGPTWCGQVHTAAFARSGMVAVVHDRVPARPRSVPVAAGLPPRRRPQPCRREPRTYRCEVAADRSRRL